MKRFDGRVVLVTGAASGIGFASATEFAAEGATLVATDIDKIALDNAFKEAASGLKIETVEQDVTDKDGWQVLVDGIIARHGRLDVLFNNAGGGDFALVDETTIEQWRFVNAVNLDGVFFGMQEAIRVMKGMGGGDHQ